MAAFGSLLFAAAPLSARVDGPKDLRDADKGCPTDAATQKSGARGQGKPHVRVFDGATGAGNAAAQGVNRAREIRPTRAQAMNNLKQMGMASCGQ
ncbi:hypothetical protein [Sphingomonas alpina]|nr:hypothetical protein [Sphingomonas alpina]